MTYKEFFKLVNDMRTAQWRYYKTHDRNDLEKVFQLQKEVDVVLRRGFESLTDNNQKQ